jgi:hypothetical protein
LLKATGGNCWSTSKLISRALLEWSPIGVQTKVAPIRTYRDMEQATENAPLFIEAFYGACGSLASDDMRTPDAEMINQILAKHGCWL